MHKLVWRNLNPGYNVVLTIKDGIQDICLLEGLLAEEQRLRINLVDLDTDKEEKFVFALTKHGKIYCSHSNGVSWSHGVLVCLIWVFVLLCQCLMWRVLQNALPVDSNFQCKGINLASKCVCCQSPSHETLRI